MAKDAPTRAASAIDHPFCVLVLEAVAVEVVMDGVRRRSFMAGGEWCGSGVSAQMNTPSPESLAHSMPCVSAACEVDHVWFKLKCI